ncbi:hypothetical protein RRG08_065871 [Elysia crispata]|uniref:Uncharacterized protein n=1 Tax=Elysia crispata TaxID=231223 RepID=A0AAE1A8H4_9GAST|nr:hypothetical protein RRG08_065871 [Elysia crispata]
MRRSSGGLVSSDLALSERVVLAQVSCYMGKETAGLDSSNRTSKNVSPMGFSSGGSFCIVFTDCYFTVGWSLIANTLCVSRRVLPTQSQIPSTYSTEGSRLPTVKAACPEASDLNA